MKCLLSVLLLLVLVGRSSAQPYYIEFALDGVLGNGPDVGSSEVGDYIQVGIWILGMGAPLLSSNFTICNWDGYLEFEEYVNELGPPWTITPPIISSENCVLNQATDFTFSSPIPVPFLQGTAIYRAAVDNVIADIGIENDPLASGWFNTFYGGEPFDDVIDCAIEVGATATEEESWGAIKSLFR